MKKVLFVVLLLLTVRCAVAQNHQYVEDTAARIINRYLRMLNYEALRGDSILYIKSAIVQRDFPSDTTWMLRWVQGNKFRVEVWAADTVQVGLLTDGVHFQEYNTIAKIWQPMSSFDYYDDAIPYDYRGPLYNWRTLGRTAQYAGEYTFQGHPVDRVFVSGPFVYDRYYLFEKESGILFMYTESETMDGEQRSDLSNHVEWRAYHEYTPLGMSLFPSVSSYLSQGSLVVIHDTVSYLPPKEVIFQKGGYEHL